jgi:hypothetical protein
MALAVDAKWNDGISVPVRYPAPSAAVRMGILRVVIEPFNDAALEGDSFCIHPVLPAIELSNAGALVEEHLPVLSGPCTVIRDKQRRLLDQRMERYRDPKHKSGSNPSLKFVKACLPDRTARDRHRYAAAVRRALNEGLSPRCFFETIRDYCGGMTAYAAGK